VENWRLTPISAVRWALAKDLEPLDEGCYTATYKFALLLARIDACLEHTESSGAPPEMVTRVSGQTRSRVILAAQRPGIPRRRFLRDHSLRKRSVPRNPTIAAIMNKVRPSVSCSVIVDCIGQITRWK
jgi:hypothetical protein